MQASLSFLRDSRRRIKLVSRPVQEGEVDAPVGISWLLRYCELGIGQDTNHRGVLTWPL